MKKLSIVTINLNNVNGLKKTLASIEEQTFKSYELIVVDGGSIDESYQIAKKCSVISTLIHERDNGIYHAMNKGIKVANGEWIFFLNSGDYIYSSDTLEKIFHKDNKIKSDIIYGRVLHSANDMKISGKSDPPSIISLEHLIRTSLPHQGMFFKLHLFHTYGLYREDLKILSDWEYYTRLFFKHDIKCKHLPLTVAVFNKEGISSLNKSRPVISQERKQVLCELLGEKSFKLITDLIESKDRLYSLEKSRIIKFALMLRNTTHLIKKILIKAPARTRLNNLKKPE